MRKTFLAVLLFASGWGVSCLFSQEKPHNPPEPAKAPEGAPGRPEPQEAPQGPPRPGNQASDAGPETIPAKQAAISAPMGTWERTRAQGVQLARMCVNEDSRCLRRLPGGTEGQPTIDHRLIAQVIFNRRNAKSTFTGWLDVMKWLSPHVGRVKEAKRHRHDVNGHLPANGEHPPHNWIDCRDVGEGEDCDGDWRVHGPYWVDFRERVVDMWLTTNFAQARKKLGANPIQWGNEDDVIRFLKRKPNACVIGMGERNFFVAYPGNGCEPDDAATVAARKGERP